MEFRYKKPQIRLSNLTGILWLIPAFLNLSDVGIDWKTILYFILGVSHLLFLFFDKQKVCIKLDDEYLYVKKMFRNQRMKRYEIAEITTHDRQVVFQGAEKTLTINKTLIHPDDIDRLIQLKV